MGAPLSADQRKLRAKLAAHSLHAHGKTSTAAARAAFMARFEREVDPDGTLPADERARRAEHAKQAYFARIAFIAAKVRAEVAK